MISIEEIITIHKILIERFGGASGIRDKGLLESSALRPFATFDSKELYPSTVEKAAAIAESIIKNHPFTDGNKRIGYTLMRLLLLNDGLDISASEEERYSFIIQIAEGKLSFEEISNWINSKLIKSSLISRYSPE